MKSFSTLLILVASAYSQLSGSEFIYSTNNYISIAYFDRLTDKFTYVVGLSGNIEQPDGKKVDEILPSYGKNVKDTGESIVFLDFGIGFPFNEIIKVDAILSGGIKRSYTTYIDNRFTDNAYHYYDNNALKLGFGINLGYRISKNYGLVIGAHSTKGINFGFSVFFM